MQKALTVFGSLMTLTSQRQPAESGRNLIAWAIRRSVISCTFCTRGLSFSPGFSIFCFLSRSAIICW